MNEIAAQEKTLYALTDDLSAYFESREMVAAQLAEPQQDSDGAALKAQLAEIDSQLDRLGADLATKTDNIAGVLRRMDVEQEHLKAEQERIHDRRKTFERAEKWLRDYVVSVMRQRGHTVTGIKTPRAQPRGDGAPNWARSLFAAVGRDRAEPVFRALTRILHPDNRATGDGRGPSRRPRGSPGGAGGVSQAGVAFGLESKNAGLVGRDVPAEASHIIRHLGSSQKGIGRGRGRLRDARPFHSTRRASRSITRRTIASARSPSAVSAGFPFAMTVLTCGYW